MLQFILVAVIGYILFKVVFKLILPFMKYIFLGILIYLAIQSGTALGYIFVGIVSLYYFNKIRLWIKGTKKDSSGRYVVYY